MLTVLFHSQRNSALTNTPIRPDQWLPRAPDMYYPLSGGKSVYVDNSRCYGRSGFAHCHLWPPLILLNIKDFVHRIEKVKDEGVRPRFSLADKA